uniref:Thioredoxin domain-containing protein n=1 Tax=viral metagenome TaxID=1070528 RepID=A0A6C0CC89_9ZZZZ
MFDNISNTQILLFIVVIAVILFASMYFSNNKKELMHKLPSKTGCAPKQYNKRADNGPKNFTLYNFYNPDCVWCKRFMPDWNKLVNDLEDVQDLSLKPIDSSKSENGDLTFYYNIKAFPTVILATPDRHIEYDGNRTSADINKFVRNVITEYNNK